METLKTIAELIGAISVIIGAFVAVEKWTKGKLSAWLLKPIIEKIDSLSGKIDEFDERFDKMELDQLKLIIMSEEIPIKERINAGDRYIEKGGNGAIKIYLHVLKEKYEESIKEG